MYVGLCVYAYGFMYVYSYTRVSMNTGLCTIYHTSMYPYIHAMPSAFENVLSN
jgi:hypothetical protein